MLTVSSTLPPSATITSMSVRFTSGSNVCFDRLFFVECRDDNRKPAWLRLRQDLGRTRRQASAGEQVFGIIDIGQWLQLMNLALRLPSSFECLSQNLVGAPIYSSEKSPAGFREVRSSNSRRPDAGPKATSELVNASNASESVAVSISGQSVPITTTRFAPSRIAASTDCSSRSPRPAPCCRVNRHSVPYRRLI